MQKYTIQNELDHILDQLVPIYGKHEAQSLAYRVFEHLMGYRPIDVHSHREQELPEDIHTRIHEVLAELKDFRPIQYIFNQAWFYDLSFFVDENVLIPRQETEELVQRIIHENGNKALRILDIGTGSGCIAISLAANLPQSEIWAMDIREEILNIAYNNATRNMVTIHTLKGDWMTSSALSQSFDLIVSNPPYVPENEKAEIPKNVLDYEPGEALFVPDDDPLIFYKEIAEKGKTLLLSAGKVYCEIHENFGNQVKRVFLEKGYNKVDIIKDIHGKDRIMKACLA